MTIALLFPGQGSQIIGMGYDFYENFQDAKEVFEEVDHSINKNLSKTIFFGDMQDLTETSNAQPAIMATSMAILRCVTKIANKSLVKISSYMAGHSLGEYTALCAANSFSLKDTSKIIQKRSEIMQKIASINNGAMVALFNCDIEKAKKIADYGSTKGVCEIANDNGAGQIIVSGSNESIDLIIKNIAIFNTRAKKLNVGGAFHSSLMKDAESIIANALNKFKMQDLTTPIISNVTSKPETQKDRIVKLLPKQVSSVVRWRESIIYASNNGVNCFVEIGPKNILTSLVKKIAPSADAVYINSIKDLDKKIEYILKYNKN